MFYGGGAKKEAWKTEGQCQNRKRKWQVQAQEIFLLQFRILTACHSIQLLLTVTLSECGQPGVREDEHYQTLLATVQARYWSAEVVVSTQILACTKLQRQREQWLFSNHQPSYGKPVFSFSHRETEMFWLLVICIHPVKFFHVWLYIQLHLWESPSAWEQFITLAFYAAPALKLPCGQQMKSRFQLPQLPQLN